MPSDPSPMQSLNTLLRTLLLGGLLAVAGWWTLTAREELNARHRELDEARTQAEELTRTVAQRDEQITKLGETLAERNERIQALHADVAERDRQIERLDIAMQLLKVSARVARIDVLSQGSSSEEPERVRTMLRFTEIGPDGEAIAPPRDLVVEGRTIYIESLVVKFQDSFIEQGDALRGTSLCLFRRIFGEEQAPNSGVELDTVGQAPDVYGLGDDRPSDSLHARIWERFWDYANDPDLAVELGIRAIHGEAPFIEARPGKSYWIDLRASDGLSIRPISSGSSGAPVPPGEADR